MTFAALTDNQELLVLCRPGFERECLAELTQAAAATGHWGWGSPEIDSGFLLFRTADAESLYLDLPELVFTRELWPVQAQVKDLPASDRVSPLVEAMTGYPRGGQVFCDTANGEGYRDTARFAGKFVHPLRQAMRTAGLLTPHDEPQKPAWHVFFPESGRALLGRDVAARRPVWPMGIARLKFPPRAPSRSTLKLEEAFRVFLGPAWRESLRQCQSAVDLGAAPGGWTWQLVRQHIEVQAVDNGPMDEALLASGLVLHRREDGFSWEPDHPVDWLVCDMVEQPSRVADRILTWLEKGWTQQALFNLKLPMKKRWRAWCDIRDPMLERLAELDNLPVMQARQLYHDRQEVTVCIRPPETHR